MKKLDISSITNSSRFPIKKGTLKFLQDAHRETLANFILGFIGPAYNPATMYVIWGMANTGTLPAYNISQGAIFFNGEVYDVDAASFTASTGNVAILNIATTSYTTDADPVTFTDSTVRNVHNINKIIVSQGATGSGLADLSQVFPLNLNIPQALNLSAPVTPPYADNLAQIIGTFPNLLLYVPNVVNPNPILAAGSVSVGDVMAGGADITVTFGTSISTANYYVQGTLISNGTDVRTDSRIVWSVRNRLVTGFQVHFEETASGTQNIAFEYICFKK